MTDKKFNQNFTIKIVLLFATSKGKIVGVSGFCDIQWPSKVIWNIFSLKEAIPFRDPSIVA